MNAVEESDRAVGEGFGPWLRRQREAAGKPRKQVASAIGIHPVQLARIETGESGTRKETLDALIAELSLDAKEAYVKAGFWPPDQAEATEASDGRIAEAARAGELVENFLKLSPEIQAQLLIMSRLFQSSSPQMLQILKATERVLASSAPGDEFDDIGAPDDFVLKGSLPSDSPSEIKGGRH